jgi:channel protein (hemolysin III family)
METAPPLYHLPGFHEPFSAMSHLLGAIVFLVLGGLLLWRGRRNPSGLPFLGIYAFAVVFQLSMSTVFHMLVRGSDAHRVIERMDHSAIFVLIAGTFTPAQGILFHGRQRWGTLVFIWSAAILGITLKAIFFERFADWVGMTIYLAMGWFGIFGAVVLGRRYGFNFVKPLLIGGIAYSVGALIDQFLSFAIVIPGVVHPHELFHMCVLMGAFWHWLFIWQFAAGDPAEKRHAPTRQESALTA